MDTDEDQNRIGHRGTEGTERRGEESKTMKDGELRATPNLPLSILCSLLFLSVCAVALWLNRFLFIGVHRCPIGG